jgi:hypothetical protein
MRRALQALSFVLVALVGPSVRCAEPPLRTGTIIMGVPREHFVVLGADRLWTNALPRADAAPAERQGRVVKIAVHRSLPLAVAVSGIASLGPEHDTVEHVRRLIAPLDASNISFDALVETLRVDLMEHLRAIREPAKRALIKNPSETAARIRLEAARLTLLVAYVASGRATLGSLQLDDRWSAQRVAAPRGAMAWPDALNAFYTRGPYAGARALFGTSIQDPVDLAAHVRHVIEAGIQEDARLYRSPDRHVAGPVDVVVIDAKSARCVPPCSPPRLPGS